MQEMDGSTLNNIVSFFETGGWAVMLSILATLIVSLILVVERSYRYWVQYDLPNSNGFMAAVQKMVMNNSIENAIRLCRKTRPKLVADVLVEGLKRANDTSSEIENALDHAALSAVPKVTKWTSFLGTTANVATLLGLLGTIFGLMHSFGSAAKLKGAEKNDALMEGIAEALYATSFGLSTALFCLFAYGILMLKSKKLTDDINKSSAKLLDLLYTRKIKIQGNSNV